MKKLISFIAIGIITMLVVLLTFSDVESNLGLFLLTKIGAAALFYVDYKIIAKAYPETMKEEV